MELPQDLISSGRSPRFDRTTVPDALLSRHSTAPDVWAKLTVFVGSVTFIDLADGEEHPVGAGGFHVIAPQREHRIEPSDDVSFELEFFRAPVRQAGGDGRGPAS